MKLCLAFTSLLADLVLGFSPANVVNHQNHGRILSSSSSSRPSSLFRNNNNNNIVSLYAQKSQKADNDFDEEVERMVQEEIQTKKRISNLRNANGVDYAPWMKISREDEEKIRTLVREKAQARRRRQEQERDVRGALLMDSQAQELSGGGLGYKIVNGGEAVELSWTTASETNTKGFLVKRRPAKSQQPFSVIASYTTFGPLASQGNKDGGAVYRYLDNTIDPPPVSYFYRVTECEKSGQENDLSQCLVEIQTVEEQRGALLGAIGIVAILVGVIVAGVVLDPMQ